MPGQNSAGPGPLEVVAAAVAVDVENLAAGEEAGAEAALEGPGVELGGADVYKRQGQYTNLQPQVDALGLGHRFDDVKEMYRTVNDMLGDIIKVTPSSKMVGDLAIFMVQNDLTPENIVERGESLAFPDSVVSYFKGMMGQPPCGFPEDLQRVVLKGEKLSLIHIFGKGRVLGKEAVARVDGVHAALFRQRDYLVDGEVRAEGAQVLADEIGLVRLGAEEVHRVLLGVDG